MLQASNRPWFYMLVSADLILRGVCLYRSARKSQRGWFIALLIVNSLGLLPLVYLIINKDKKGQASETKPTPKKSTKKSKK